MSQSEPEQFEAIAKELAKNTKTENDLSQLSRALKKMTAEAALGAEMEAHLGCAKHDLYNENSTETDFKSAYRVLTRHRVKIFGADGTASNADDYDMVNQSRLSTAISWGNDLGIPVKTIQQNFQAAFDEFNQPQYTQGVSVTWDHILVGEDDGTTSGIDTRYYRNTDQDILTGSTSNDLLDGQGGQDVLYGGTGLDLYRIHPGDGNDTINDEDGHGCSSTRSAIRRTDYLRHHDTVFITCASHTDPGTSSGIVVENYSEGALGLVFDMNRPLPETTNTINFTMGWGAPYCS